MAMAFRVPDRVVPASGSACGHLLGSSTYRQALSGKVGVLPQVHIYDTPADARHFAEMCSDHADQNRDSLGFLPRTAYFEAAEKGNLMIAVAGDGPSEMYAGHLLFGGRFPHLKVFQLYVDASFRGLGVATELLSRLIRYAERHCALSVSARVAADLPANAFWERKGFALLREEEGGASRGRRINIRVRDVDSPNLFGELSDRHQPAVHRPSEPQPVYVIDVNVFLDVLKERNRAPSAKRLLQAAFAGVLQLFVTQEFVRELRRARATSEVDPVCALAETLPQFPDPPEETTAPLVEQLRLLIFPSRQRTVDLNPRELSDLRP